ncbi:MAG: DUF805 domain-containing protein [Leucobacter sp.]|jgi:uncharacterized membrane protein YhaH (DUF805 family)
MSYPTQDPNQQPQYPAAPAYAAPAVGGVPGPGEPFDGAASPDQLNRPLYGASFGQAVKRFFKNYANFKGRASRSEYWWVALFTFLIELIPLILYIIGLSLMAGGAIASADSSGNFTTTPASEAAIGGGAVLFTIGLILLIVIGLAILIPSLAIAWRRLHDANFAGPFWFLSLTSVGSIIVLIFTLLPPKPEGRRFDV